MKSYKDLLAENMQLKKSHEHLKSHLITVAVDLMNECYHQAMRENRVSEARAVEIRKLAIELIENKGE
jgi:hypothetical protein